MKRPALALLPLVLALLVAALVWRAQPRSLTLSGESESDTRAFPLAGRRYALSADLLPECQYTFYLTPAGEAWKRAGTAVASASGETALDLQTAPVKAGRYFVHAFTAPEEGCSWTLRLRPL